MVDRSFINLPPLTKACRVILPRIIFDAYHCVLF